jgi:hypothetical protein
VTQRSSRVEVTDFTCAVCSIFVICAAVSGSPPPAKPRAPAGVTVTVLPTLAFTSSMRACTAFSDSNMTKANAMVSARIAVIEMLRMVLRNAFFTPLVVTLIPPACRAHPGPNLEEPWSFPRTQLKRVSPM